MNNDQDILQEIKQAVTSVDGEAEVILFGSRARGDFHEESDWDVLVLTTNINVDRQYKREVRNALLQLELKYSIVITGIIRQTSFWSEMKFTPFYKEVQKDGLVL